MSPRLSPALMAHPVLGTGLKGPWPQGSQVIYLAMGCFWGVEQLMWQTPGVVGTAVGYMGGDDQRWPQPSYQLVCTGATGHTETVQVVYDPQCLTTAQLLSVFWQNHDPTTPDRQGNDVGSQYRSALFTTTDEQLRLAVHTRGRYATALADRGGFGPIVTDIRAAQGCAMFWLAEAEHQQYLHHNPGGYCPTHATGVPYPRQ